MGPHWQARGLKQLRLDRPHHQGRSVQKLAGLRLGQHALLEQRRARRGMGLHHHNRGGWRALTKQAANDCAGHIAPANEGDAICHAVLLMAPSLATSADCLFVGLATPITDYKTACCTACSQRAISSCARSGAMAGRKRRSARHKALSSSVFW